MVSIMDKLNGFNWESYHSSNLVETMFSVLKRKYIEKTGAKWY
jgi:hypothetical protein